MVKGVQEKAQEKLPKIRFRLTPLFSIIKPSPEGHKCPSTGGYCSLLVLFPRKSRMKRYKEKFRKTTTLCNRTPVCKAALQHSCCDAAGLLCHLGIRDVIKADHRLRYQPHTELEAEDKWHHLIFITQLWRAVTELFKGLLLRLHQRPHQLILISGPGSVCANMYHL